MTETGLTSKLSLSLTASGGVLTDKVPLWICICIVEVPLSIAGQRTDCAALFHVSFLRLSRQVLHQAWPRRLVRHMHCAVHFNYNIRPCKAT